MSTVTTNTATKNRGRRTNRNRGRGKPNTNTVTSDATPRALGRDDHEMDNSTKEATIETNVEEIKPDTAGDVATCWICVEPIKYYSLSECKIEICFLVFSPYKLFNTFHAQATTVLAMYAPSALEPFIRTWIARFVRYGFD